MSNTNNSNKKLVKKLVPEAMSALDKFKYEVASEVGVTLKDGYNGDISAKDAGKIGGNMVRKMIQQVENNMANK
ncbi:MAG: acid-soluble spore protein [Clostridium sp. 28_12]|nr:MAG: acid-soluble spore protein [Clostridium sp. 28_12]